MGNKSIEDVLKYIGITIIVVGILGSIILSFVIPGFKYEYSRYSGYYIEESYNWAMLIIGSIASFVVGMSFVGFSEVISLLSANLSLQGEILKSICKVSLNTVESRESCKSELEDIEANLPKI